MDSDSISCLVLIVFTCSSLSFELEISLLWSLASKEMNNFKQAIVIQMHSVIKLSLEINRLHYIFNINNLPLSN